MGRLTVKRIAKLTEPGRYTDGLGLHLFVSKGGGRSWVQRIVIQGIRRDIGLGSLRAVALSQARQLAFENWVTARRGGDPYAGRRAAQSPTVRQAAAKVATAHGAKWSKAHATDRAATLERHVFPVLGDRRVSRIGKADVLAVLGPIWTEQPGAGRKVRTALRAIMAWAVAHGYAEHNVVDAVGGALPAQPAVREHMRAMPYREVPAALRKIAAAGRVSESARAALRFLVLTACRTVEVRGAKWGEIDLFERTWTIPAERMKAGREHRVPLSDAAVDVLESVRHLRRGDLVFPSPGSNGGSGMLARVTLNNAMRSAGLGDYGTPHGFRSSFRDWCGERTDTEHAVCEKALAHAVGSAVERSYARSDLFEKRRGLMAAWAEYVC